MVTQASQAHKAASPMVSNSHFEEAHTAPLAAFAWERRRLACSGSGQDGRAPRALGNGHDPRLRLFASQMAKMRIAELRLHPV